MALSIDILIRTYFRDFRWLKLSLHSIMTFVEVKRPRRFERLRGSEIPLSARVVVICCADYANDYVGQQISKLNADKITDAKLIAHVDSDCIFHAPCSLPAILTKNGLPIIRVLRRSNRSACDGWRRCIADFHGNPLPFDVLAPSSFLYSRSLYCDLRGQCVRHFGVTLNDWCLSRRIDNLSEFGLLAGQAWFHHRDDYCWIAADNGACRPCRAYWSRARRHRSTKRSLPVGLGASRVKPVNQKRSKFLSLIIASLDEGEELLETLESVFAGSIVPAETIVIDDGSTDGSCAALCLGDWHTQNVTVHRVERGGIAAARNAGSMIAEGAHLMFLDAHCRLDFDCLATLDSVLAARADAILAPAICDFGSAVYGCGARLIDAELRVRWLPPGATGDVFTRVPIAPGGCLVVSRMTFDQMGGFGSFRELGLEDVDFSLRAWRTGVDVLAVPAAKLRHKFRPNPPYRISSASRAYNVARVALIHFDGLRRKKCLQRVIGTPRAAEVLVDAFSSDWQHQRSRLEAMSSRSIDSYFDVFGDWS